MTKTPFTCQEYEFGKKVFFGYRWEVNVTIVHIRVEHSFSSLYGSVGPVRTVRHRNERQLCSLVQQTTCFPQLFFRIGENALQVC